MKSTQESILTQQYSGMVSPMMTKDELTPIHEALLQELNLMYVIRVLKQTLDSARLGLLMAKNHVKMTIYRSTPRNHSPCATDSEIISLTQSETLQDIHHLAVPSAPSGSRSLPWLQRKIFRASWWKRD